VSSEQRHNGCGAKKATAVGCAMEVVVLSRMEVVLSRWMYRMFC
jgi:hypothetical protein